MSRLMHSSNFRQSSSSAKLSFILAYITTLSLLIAVGYDYYTDVLLSTDCSGHLKLASDANSIKLAEEELNIAINYIEVHKLTQGSTGVLFHYPQYDVSFWYKNLKSAQNQLKQLRLSSEGLTPLSQIEETNTLMKLRETLLDHEKSGDVITIPNGLNLHPNNLNFAIWTWLSLLLAVLCWVWFYFEV